MSDDDGYDNLPTIIGQMKRAAIDSFMSEQNWPPHKLDDSYYSLWGFIGSSSYDRPAADGSGGGAAHGFSEFGESMAPSFDNIRATIDGYVNPWIGLPDGSRAAPLKQDATSAATVFGTTGTGASVNNDGDLGRSNLVVSDTLISSIEGSFVAPFHDKYYSQFGNVASGLGAACAILEINYAAQAVIWPAAKKDAAKICVNAREALKDKADQAAGEYGKVALTVVGAVVGLAATIVTAGAAAPAVITLASIAAVATTASAVIEADAVISGSTYSEILDSLGEALDALNAEIVDRESKLNTMMSEAVDAIYADLPGFDLDAYSQQVFPGPLDKMTMQRSKANLVSSNMTRVHDALASAETFLGTAPTLNPTPRDFRIGAGTHGTQPNAAALHEITARCLSLTRAEYERGQTLFEAVVEDYFTADADSAALVAQLAADEALTEQV